MACPHCGSEKPVEQGRCVACGAPRSDGPVQVAAGLLTPLPPADLRAGGDTEETDDFATREFVPSGHDPLEAPRAPESRRAPEAPAVRKASGAPPEDDLTRLAGPDSDTGLPGARDKSKTGPLQAGQAFGSRYHIIRLLGIGGMGAVYHAWDAELGVAVALKVIRPEVTADPKAAADLERRFKRELLLARQVTHKNVVRIHDLGEIDGIKYITMPYVQGSDLATVLKQTGKLPVRAALRIAREVVSGLVAAHEAGVVHRDLKPANIMVDGEHALIMDFGIARSTSRSGTEGLPSGVMPPDLAAMRMSAPAAAATVAGAVVGTLEYMAPEQAKAEAVDQRADIYAFGLILYDLLLGGRHATGARTAIEDLRERMAHAPPPARSINPEIPEALDRLISKCIEPDPAARYQTSHELAADLDLLDDEGVPIPVPKHRLLSTRMRIAAVMVLLVMLGGTWWLARRGVLVAPVQHEPVSVLIADFDNRAKDPVFEGSLEQALREAMEGASFVTVFPRANARQLAAQLVPASGGRVTLDAGRLISRREGIKVLVAGEIDRRDGGYRLAVRAIDPATDTDRPIVAAEERAGSRAEVMNALAEAAKTVRSALGETKTEMARLAAAETFTTSSFEAMNAYARGQDFFYFGKYQDAISAFQEAIKSDPQFGRAYAMLGTAYWNLKQSDKAKENFDQALKRLDRMTEREKYRTLGGYYLGVVGNYPKGIETFEELVKLYPADNVAYNNLALGYLWSLNVPRAMEVARKGIEIYPNNLMNRTNYAAYATYAGQFDVGVAEATRVLKQNPMYEAAYLPLALSNLARGDVKGARDTYARLATLSDTGASFARMGEADLELYLGRYKEALDALRVGIAADQKAGNQGGLASKHIAQAEAQLALGRRAQAASAAAKALAANRHESVLFLAARVFLEIGQEEKARKLAAELESKLQSQTTAYARLLQGELALRARRPSDAIEAIRDGQKRYDAWFTHFLLGRVYWEAGHAPEALEEFERCLKRRGEAADVFFNDSPTLRYLPSLYYWAARAQEAVGATAGARANYEQYVKIRSEASSPDPLVPDARKRLGP